MIDILNFDFDAISKKFHLANKLWKEWCDQNMLSYHSPAYMDFFFDEQKIQGFISPHEDCDSLTTQIYIEEPEFGEDYFSEGKFHSRTEALQNLYLKEFDILEARLEAKGK